MVEGILQIGGEPLWVLALLSLFLLVGLAFMTTGLLYVRRYVHMKRLEPVDAYEVDSGTVELEGTVHPGDRTLEAPFSGSECVAYEFEVEKYRHDDDGSNWKTKREGSAQEPFRVRDATGAVGVEPTADSLSLERDYRTVVGRGEDPPPRIQAFLDEEDTLDHDTGSFTLGPLSVETGDKHRFTERRLDPGQTVYVTGTADAMHAVAGETPSITPTEGDRLRSLFADPFIVADVGETHAQRRQLFGGLGALLFGLLFAAIPSVMLYVFLFG